MKSYNKDALRGLDVDDKAWQADVMEATGISIPDEYLYTQKAPVFLMESIRAKNTDDMITRQGMNPKEAKMMADKTFKTAMKSYQTLLQDNKK